METIWLWIATIIVIWIICIVIRGFRSIKCSQHNTGASSLEKERALVIDSIPAGMGALIDHPIGTSIIGYYKDGVVYTKSMVPVGTYRDESGFFSFYHNDMDYRNEAHDKRIGWYSDKSNGNGGMIFAYNNDRSDKVAEIYDGYGFIHPEQDATYKTVTFTKMEDAAGAAAAYVILLYCARDWNEEFLEYFVN